jgi:hypothetical protein
MVYYSKIAFNYITKEGAIRYCIQFSARRVLEPDVGRPILAAAGFLAGFLCHFCATSRLKGGCGQDWPPHIL